MYKTITQLAILLSTLIFASTATAGPQYYLSPNSLGHYEFHPNQEVTISNPLFFSIKAHCTLTSSNESNVLHATMLKKSGSLKNKTTGQTISLSSGQSGSMNVANNDMMDIDAKAFAKVAIINQGDITVVANCSM